MGTYLVRTFLRYVLRVIKTHCFGVIGQTDHRPVTGLLKWSRGKLGKLESRKTRKKVVTVLEEVSSSRPGRRGRPGAAVEEVRSLGVAPAGQQGPAGLQQRSRKSVRRCGGAGRAAGADLAQQQSRKSACMGLFFSKFLTLPFSLRSWQDGLPRGT